MVFLIQDHHHVPAHGYKIVMRHFEAASVGCNQCEWLKTILQTLSDVSQIHGSFIALKASPDKPVI